MKTLICNAPHDMEYIERDKPTYQPNEALIKLKAAGICGTDIHAYTGNQPFFSYPRVLGHELCGVVEECGESCSDIRIGDRVSVIPCVACGDCVACAEGKTNCCENVSLYGVHQDGGFCEYLAVLESNLVKVNSNLSDSTVALTECFAIGAHAVRRGQVADGENVLVIGAGPIGIGAAAIAKARGANVVVADVNPSRQAHVESTLNVKAVNPLSDSFEADLRAQFSGELADTLMDATGNKASMTNAVNFIRHGGKMVFIGLYIGDLQIDDPTFHKKETTLISSRNATREDFETVLAFFESGALSEDMMVNQEFDFHTFGEDYASVVASNQTLIKGVVKY
ncbi:hypothetical protein VINI7043_07580 [Vibrio nigripulchritudo ATCC 27043]|uniref:zinc-binding alcohol dehydrogenase family protein n=1 Tax=Vibrio nigripulchritudo TaxID=28173 RepID=UPI00021C1F79|nr:zinc-binding alcohol dehydrogenase family protein [Vibrio nigripulchritudo]EGU57656.1 hypothetical protein VINI7043_07580 [Vibrio nigripulchritudo ATCC 27043]